jgi:dihydrolipoamide dehydrogenase
VTFAAPKIDVAGVRAYWMKVVDTLSKNLLELCKRRKVEFVHARATLEDRQTVKLDDGSRRRFHHGVLGLGSVPAQVPGLSLDSPRVMDSTAALKLEEVPRSLLVVGGGYIGLEMGTVYAALGSRVTVVELTDGLLPGVDRDLVRPLQARLAAQFERIYLNTKIVKLAEAKDGIRATLEGEEVENKEPVFGRVLVSVGRRPNTRGVGLEKAGVEVDEKGFIKVDAQRRTTNERIFAIGDAAGEPMLAHKATHEGKVAAEAILGEPAAFEPRAIPAVVFTDPEIAWCGLTETEAKADKREVNVARFPWAASGRAVSLGRTEGLTKIITEPGTDRVLGVGIAGVGAGELIGEGVLAVEMAASARDLALSIHAHPTLTETVGEAAEALYGSTTHLLRKAKA